MTSLEALKQYKAQGLAVHDCDAPLNKLTRDVTTRQARSFFKTVLEMCLKNRNGLFVMDAAFRHQFYSMESDVQRAVEATSDDAVEWTWNSLTTLTKQVCARLCSVMDYFVEYAGERYLQSKRSVRLSELRSLMQHAVSLLVALLQRMQRPLVPQTPSQAKYARACGKEWFCKVFVRNVCSGGLHVRVPHTRLPCTQTMLETVASAPDAFSETLALAQAEGM